VFAEGREIRAARGDRTGRHPTRAHVVFSLGAEFTGCQGQRDDPGSVTCFTPDVLGGTPNPNLNGAIELSFAYLGRENDKSVGHFAREIVIGQSQETAIMNQLLLDAGGAAAGDEEVAMEWMGEPVTASRMPGMATEGEFAALRASEGLEADDEFTRLMIRHHAGGIEMAEYAAANGKNDRVRRLAAAIAKVQRTEIVEMELRRKALGLPPVDTSDIDGVHGAHSK